MEWEHVLLNAALMNDYAAAERRLRALQQCPQAFGHPVEAVEWIETHISWLLLAGEFVYKFKKPMKLDFLDFSTLALRCVACAEELRINRRTAPDLYLGLVALVGSTAADLRLLPLDEAPSNAEPAVRMRRFDQVALLSQALERQALTPAHIDALARHVAHFHGDAARAGVRHRRCAPRCRTAWLPCRGWRPMHRTLRRCLARWRSGASSRALRWRRCSRSAWTQAGCANAMATCTWRTWCSSTVHRSCSMPSNSTPRCAGSTAWPTSPFWPWTWRRAAAPTWRGAFSTPGWNAPATMRACRCWTTTVSTAPWCGPAWRGCAWRRPRWTRAPTACRSSGATWNWLCASPGPGRWRCGWRTAFRDLARARSRWRWCASAAWCACAPTWSASACSAWRQRMPAAPCLAASTRRMLRAARTSAWRRWRAGHCWQAMRCWSMPPF